MHLPGIWCPAYREKGSRSSGFRPFVPFHRPTPICSCADDSTPTPLLCKCAHTAEVMGSDRQESKRQHLFPSIHLLVRTMARPETQGTSCLPLPYSACPSRFAAFPFFQFASFVKSLVGVLLHTWLCQIWSCQHQLGSAQTQSLYHQSFYCPAQRLGQF